MRPDSVGYGCTPRSLKIRTYLYTLFPKLAYRFVIILCWIVTFPDWLGAKLTLAESKHHYDTNVSESLGYYHGKAK